MTTSDDAALRVSIEDCFKRTKMQQEGDTELFDTQLTIDNIMQLITQHTAFAVQAARIDEARMWRTDSDNRKHVDDRIKQLQADAGRSGETA